MSRSEKYVVFVHTNMLNCCIFYKYCCIVKETLVRNNRFFFLFCFTLMVQPRESMTFFQRVIFHQSSPILVLWNLLRYFFLWDKSKYLEICFIFLVYNYTKVLQKYFRKFFLLRTWDQYVSRCTFILLSMNCILAVVHTGNLSLSWQ